MSPSRLRLTRRAALVLPLGFTACSWFDDLLTTHKTPLPGDRISVLPAANGIIPAKDAPKPVLPTPVENAAWPQSGGNPAHVMNHLAAGERLAVLWTADIGDGGGYRRKITAQPVIGGDRVFTMDSDGVVDAYDIKTGRRFWRTETQGEKDRSTNVGGGLGLEGDVLYATTGRAELLAIEPTTGKISWRVPLPGPARSAPTIADGRVFLNTIDDQLNAFSADDGHKLWSYHANGAVTSVLGQPAPAYSDGIVVGGFPSGELTALRATSGTTLWSDNLGAASGRTALADLSAIRGLPAIADGRLFVTSLGNVTASLDLRSGRRLWERNAGGAESPWIAGDWMFVLSGDQQIMAIHRTDGTVAWLADLPKFEDEKKKSAPYYWRGPLLAGDRLIVVGSNQKALAVSPYTGEILGQQDLSGPASVSPVIAQSTVFLVTDDAGLTALR